MYIDGVVVAPCVRLVRHGTFHDACQADTTKPEFDALAVVVGLFSVLFFFAASESIIVRDGVDIESGQTSVVRAPAEHMFLFCFRCSAADGFPLESVY